MLSFRKIPQINKELLDLHKNKIIKELDITSKFKVYYGDEACNFFRKYEPDYQKKSNKQILRNLSGYFIYDKLPQNYKEEGVVGVVCVFNGKIGTLAHELRHAKQRQDNSKWMELVKWKKFYYKYAYALYPTEVGAFSYAAWYLIKSRFLKLFFFYLINILTAIIFKTRIFLPVLFLAIIKYIMWLNQMYE